MKDALKANGFEKMHLMVQPLGYHTPDAGKQGFIDLPEFPFGMRAHVTHSTFYYNFFPSSGASYFDEMGLPCLR